MQVTKHGLPVTRHALPVTQHALAVTQHDLPISQHGLPVTEHLVVTAHDLSSQNRVYKARGSECRRWGPIGNRIIRLVQIVHPVGSCQAIASMARFCLCGRGGTQSPPFSRVYPPQGQKQAQGRTCCAKTESFQVYVLLWFWGSSMT